MAGDSERTRLSEVDDEGAHEVEPDQHAGARHDQIWPWHQDTAGDQPRQGEAEQGDVPDDADVDVGGSAEQPRVRRLYDDRARGRVGAAAREQGPQAVA